jgi:hypothetical protein
MLVMLSGHINFLRKVDARAFSGPTSRARRPFRTVTGANDWFGHSVEFSADGSTLAVGALGEDSNALGIGGDQLDNLAGSSGAVCIYPHGQYLEPAGLCEGSNTAQTTGSVTVVRFRILQFFG